MFLIKTPKSTILKSRFKSKEEQKPSVTKTVDYFYRH